MEWYKGYQDEVNTGITKLFHERYISNTSPESEFQEAMRYAVEGGGKRIRIILALLAYEHTYGSIDRDKLIRGLLGLECIHAYTLVHDDMPCMDNDILRRGKPTVWKKYGETLATLVGDGLQTLGFELLASLGNISIIQEISRALGDMGVVLGQVQDTMGTQTDLTYDELMQLHDRKTGGFIASSLVVGATLGSASEKDIQAFRDIGFFLGRAFQIRDDILDYEGDVVSLGKNTGKDIILGKGIVAKIGIEKAKEELQSIRNQLINITGVGFSQKIQEIALFIVDRKN